MNFQMMAAGDNPLSHVVQHPLKTLHVEALGGEITVLSDQIVMMIVAALLLAIFMPIFVRKPPGHQRGRPLGADRLRQLPRGGVQLPA